MSLSLKKREGKRPSEEERQLRRELTRLGRFTTEKQDWKQHKIFCEALKHPGPPRWPADPVLKPFWERYEQTAYCESLSEARSLHGIP